MSFSFLFFRLVRHSICGKKIFTNYRIIQLLDVAFVDKHTNQVIIFLRLVKDTVMQTEKPLINNRLRV